MKPMTHTPQAFIFDLDGVLTDTAEFHYLAWNQIAEELHVPFSRKFNEKLKGVSRMDSLKLLLSQDTSGRTYTPEEMNELADRKNRHYVTMVDRITPADILPGIPELLTELKANGVKIGLASASKNAFAVVRNLGIEDSLDAIADAAKIARNKPDPEIFLKAAELLNVEPSACVGVEDAVSGVQAIKAAGMFAVAVGAKEAFPHADLVCGSTVELRYAEIAKAFADNM
jgi:beta-phosphoglucomutase